MNVSVEDVYDKFWQKRKPARAILNTYRSTAVRKDDSSLSGDAYLQGANLDAGVSRKWKIMFAFHFWGLWKNNFGSLFLERNLNMSSAAVSYHIAF